MGAFIDFLDEFLPKTLIGVVLFVIMVAGFLWLGEGLLPESVFASVILLAPIWVPVALFTVFANTWMQYVQTKGYFAREYSLLEIRLPREVTQSPLAMENALNAFFHTGEPHGLTEKYIEGKTRPQFSLEIVSFEGELRFFVRTRASLRNIIEAQLYSQYPTIEIEEVPDYINGFSYDPEVHELFGLEQTLQKPDPYPIKTYIDFGLDKEQKEEFKIDPLTGILEFLGSFTKGEYGFMQIIIRSHESEKRVPGKFFKRESWREEAKRLSDEIVEKLKTTSKGSQGEFTMYRAPTPEEKDLLDALARNTAKKPFDAGIRLLYLADKEHFNGDRRAGYPTMFRQFESHTFNGFKPVFRTLFKNKLDDPTGKRVIERKREIFEAYRVRSYLVPPFKRPWRFVLSAEELATVFHLPGRVAQTPTIGRIPSRRAEAPPNLPT